MFIGSSRRWLNNRATRGDLTKNNSLASKVRGYWKSLLVHQGVRVGL